VNTLDIRQLQVSNPVISTLTGWPVGFLAEQQNKTILQAVASTESN
jgi:hypothetical protein